MKKREQRRRARRGVVSFLVGFLMIQVGLSWTLESGDLAVIDHEFAVHLRQVRELRAQQSEQPFLLALGGSRLLTALDPDAIEQEPNGQDFLVYNHAMAGAGVAQVLVALGRYLDNGLRPDYLLVEINPGCMCWEAPIFKYAQMQSMTIREMLAVTPYTKGTAWMCETLLSRRAVPCYTMRKHILQHAAPYWLPQQTAANESIPARRRGGHPLDLPFITAKDRNTHNARARREYQALLQDFRISTKNEAALGALLSRCKKEKISVALILTPEGPMFRRFYRTGAREELLTVLHRAIDSSPGEIIDTWTWCPEEDFLDSHHMLAGPATHYTRRLWRERLTPWLQPKPTSLNNRARFKTP